MKNVFLLATLVTLGACGASDDPAVEAASNNLETAGADTSMNSFRNDAVARARSWVDAKMPYCGAPNGQPDSVCDPNKEDVEVPLCKRPSKKQWDKYRSDCSGLVSYAWALPAPGLTTKGFAPHFDANTHEDAISFTIPGTDLKPGDALNSASHIMLFAGWVDEETGLASFIEEPKCGGRAKQVTVTLGLEENSSRVTLLDWDGKIYDAIRYGGADI